MTDIRLRFAPSPTGFLHIGNLRTVLFGYLLAKSLKGEFILRIEDTDQKREVSGSVASLLDVLDWVGIKFDEGPHKEGKFGPYVQTNRLNMYKEHIDRLIAEDKAYHCFCTSERLTNMREEQQAQKLAPRYDRCCRDLSKDEIKKKLNSGDPFVIRQKMPLEGEIVVHDELRGDIKFRVKDLEDHVLIKSNGVPTYQFANIVDDHLMEISHVTRGEEWIPSFPKNVLLYQAFGWKVPKFIHLPLILNKEGGKLSKRQGDVFVEDFKKNGYLPEAIINFCALLGWHPKEDDQEIFSLKDLENQFQLDELRVSPAVFDAVKLDFFNGYYIRQKTIGELVELCKPYLITNLELSNDDNKKTGDYIKQVVALEQERLKKVSDISELTKLFFVDKLEYDADLLIWKKLTKEDVVSNLKDIIKKIEIVKEWNQENLDKTIIEYLTKNKKKIGDYLWPMRVALTGEKNSPGPFEVAGVLGREESVKRINDAIGKLA